MPNQVQGIALAAANLYKSIEQRPKVNADTTTVQGAKEFQNMVKVQFNKYAQMSPDEILSHIKKVQNPAGPGPAGAPTNNFAASSIKSVRESLQIQEATTRKSLVNEASLIDVLTSTTEATNTLKALVEARNKFMEAHDKVMNMSV